MRNFSVNVDGKTYWVSRSMAVVAYVFAQIGGEWCVLVNRRGPGVTKAGLWNAPSGFLDYGESLKDAAIREVWEETGLKLPSDHTPNHIVFPWDNDRFHMVELDDDAKRTNGNVLVRFAYFMSPELVKNTDAENCITLQHSEPDEVDCACWMPIKEIGGYFWVSEKHTKVMTDVFKAAKECGAINDIEG